VELGEYDKAIDSFKAALALNYDPGDCHFAIGDAQERAGRYQEAIHSYERARAQGYHRDWCDKGIAFCRKRMLGF
jgi:tetratricopeptide (TPR) repeat protein